MAETADRVKETSTTTGTGTFDLDGAVVGFQTFVAGVGTGNTCYYCATDGTDWEVGIGTVTDAATDTLSRDRILASSNANAEVNWGAGTKTIFVTQPAATGGRERLSADRTYYVRTDGSDSNNGLADSAGGAWLTIQKAIDEVAKLDISIYTVTIQLGAGTYDLGSTGVTIKFPLGAGSVILLGDTTTPSNVVVTNTSIAAGGNMFACQQPSPVSFYIKGIKITSSSSGTYVGGFQASFNGRLTLESIEFGAWSGGANGRHMNCESQGYINIIGNYTISGGVGHHMIAFNGYIANSGKTITLSGTPAFTRFAYATGLGYIRANSCTFSGSGTGTRYLVSENSVIYTGGGANYFPGNVAGSTATGGQYL